MMEAGSRKTEVLFTLIFCLPTSDFRLLTYKKQQHNN